MKSTKAATQRTKNRLREHKLELNGNPREVFFHGKPHRLFTCTDHCAWFGWIPIEEVTFTS